MYLDTSVEIACLSGGQLLVWVGWSCCVRMWARASTGCIRNFTFLLGASLPSKQWSTGLGAKKNRTGWCVDFVV